LIYGSEGGRLILASFVAATMTGVPNHALYAGSKLPTRSFAADCGKKKTTVNALVPGDLLTDMYLENSWHYGLEESRSCLSRKSMPESPVCVRL
jgi:3-oxoacyl-[acyl-carrier protein] reductase